MARTKKTKRRVTTRRVAKTPKKIGDLWLVAWLPVLFQSLLVVGVGFGLQFLFNQSYDKVVSHPKFLLDTNSVSVKMPKWIKPDHDLGIDFSQILKGRTLFDKTIRSEIQERFEHSPLVASVERLDLQMPNTIMATLRLRRPVVRVNHGNKTFLMDKEGMVLSTKPYMDVDKLPLISGKGTEQIVVGREHPSNNIRGVLELLMMWEKRKFDNLKVYEISCAGLDDNQRGGQPDYVFHIYNGVRTVKLFFDKGERRGDVKLDEALDNLQQIVYRNPDLSHVGSKVDLRWKDPAIF